MFLCEDNFFGKFFPPAYEYWDIFPTFHTNINYLREAFKNKSWRDKKKLLCIFAWFRACFDINFWKWKKVSKLRPPPSGKESTFFLMNPSLKSIITFLLNQIKPNPNLFIREHKEIVIWRRFLDTGVPSQHRKELVRA